MRIEGAEIFAKKPGFWNKQVYIHTSLKLSSHHQTGLEMPRLATECPGQPLRDQLGQLGALEGL